MATKIVLSLLFALALAQSCRASDDAATSTVQNLFGPLEAAIKDIEAKGQALISQLQGNTQLYLFNVSSVFQGLKDRVDQTISKINQLGQGAATCVTSERQNVSTLITQGQQQAQACGKQIIADVQPYVGPFVNTTKEVVALIQDVAPGVIQCVSANGNNVVGLGICLSTQFLPKISQIQKVIGDVNTEYKSLQQAVQVLKPELQQCQTQFQNSVSQVNAIVKEIEQCFSNLVQQQKA